MLEEDFSKLVRFYYKADTGGRTQYQRHIALYKAEGSLTDELKNPLSIPSEFEHIFKWFTDLDKTRRNYVGMSFAYGALIYQEIKAYFDLKSIDYINLELEILLMLDSLFLQIMNEKEKE
ncbi:MAG: phage tail assembly chaperone [Wohlfahrtiimonas sp.]